MKRSRIPGVAAAVIFLFTGNSIGAVERPFDQGKFRGRIAYSADGKPQ
jgi:hypothetical protein